LHAKALKAPKYQRRRCLPNPTRPSRPLLPHTLSHRERVGERG